MDNTTTIRLGKTDSVFFTNREEMVHVELDHTTKKLPITDVSKVIDQYEVYRTEASACNRYRLTLTVKPYCTNVLFNTCTEIIKDEGSANVEVVTDNTSTTINDAQARRVIGGLTSGIKRGYMLDNTEYSSEDIGYKYHPGYDIFGNHIIRNLSFRSVIPITSSSPTYNTIEDDMRTMDGSNIPFCPRKSATDTTFIYKHLYEKTDLLSMQNGDSVMANLKNENGWYGFYNNSSITQKRKKLTGSTPQETIRDANHTVNDRDNCEFVDMYPDRTLYSFTPKINEYRHRLENNWDVFITYPYENFYHHNLVTNVYAYDLDSAQIDFDNTAGDEKTNALLLLEANSQICRNGMNGLQFRSFCKHNLKQNDHVVIYYSLDYGATFTPCKGTFRVNYTGDMKNGNKDYYFAITNSSILDEIFAGNIESTFYNSTTTPPTPLRNVNGPLTELPLELNTTDSSYIPDICQWYYKQLPSNPMVTWSSSNTVDNLPADVQNGPVYVRKRKKNADEYIYTYYEYNGTAYQMTPVGFDPTTETFGNGNTFDDIPVGYVTQYIRVHVFEYYQQDRIYWVQKGTPVSDIVNSQLCYYIPLRFAKIVGGIKCKYYIRKFKKLPNLNKSHEDLTNAVATNRVKFDEYVNLNATKTVNGNLKMRDFQRETYPLAFSKTLYGDDITQFQFTESMDVSYIRDNLNRPLTELFVTIVKKNVGYKDWYEKGKYTDYKENNVEHRVEFSHCFGKITSGLDFLHLSTDDYAEIIKNNGFLSDARYITNSTTLVNTGQPLEFWGSVHMNNGETDGILEDDETFFGDVVEYNPSTVMETVLSDVQFRFNTAQRENGNENEYVFTYKEIVTDDYDDEGFEAKSNIDSASEFPTRVLLCPEGYYYKAHYRMGVKEFSTAVNQASHYSVMVDSAEPVNMDGIFIRVKTKNNHGYSVGRGVYICNDTDRIWYRSSIVSVDSKTSFVMNVIPKDVEVYEGKPYLNWIQTCNLINSGMLKLRAENRDIPDYADNISVNLFLWRDIIPASESNDETMSAYPFTNGALYIDKCVNFFLKRQDPDGINGLYYYGDFPDVEGRIEEPSNYMYIPEGEVIC